MKKVAWTPAVLFGIGALFVVGIDGQRDMELTAPLTELIDGTIDSYVGSEIELTDDAVTVAGVNDYVLREYVDEAATVPWYSIYVGYYESQLQGRSIHSPRNCLPGSGWEALASEAATVTGADGDVTVNRYLIQNEHQRALVLYWYQGRGRVEANEYQVKWDLLVDAAINRRTEEALVRIVVPFPLGDEAIEDVEALAIRIAAQLLPELQNALPS